MLRFLHFLNFSETKLPPVSDIMFFGDPYSAKIISHNSIRLSTDRHSVILTTRNLLWFSTRQRYLLLLREDISDLMTSSALPGSSLE